MCAVSRLERPTLRAALAEGHACTKKHTTHDEALPSLEGGRGLNVDD